MIIIPKVKRFQARIPRNQSYSMHTEIARIREIEQSRIDLDTEIARIDDKFHTRLSRTKVNIRL
jgi:hypothetical protein